MKYKIVEFKNIHGYVDDQNTVWLNAGDVAKIFSFSVVDDEGEEQPDMEKVNAEIEFYMRRKKFKENDFMDEATVAVLASKLPFYTYENFAKMLFKIVIPEIRKLGSLNLTVNILQDFMQDISKKLNKLDTIIFDIKEAQDKQQQMLKTFKPINSTIVNKKNLNLMILKYARMNPEFSQDRQKAYNNARREFVTVFKEIVGIDLERRTINRKLKIKGKKFDEIDIVADLRGGKYLPLALSIIQGMLENKKYIS